ncbi:hypothetical protein AWC38_SpisGene7317 [Stylophora pistillata]|uniref:Uncharacterized protein n=1 Tax=Stylophora pistillata TaxID=50429 RepID=A0A2B4SGJ3_STYPI|nr:hypothetical protein AWC38_SpisGene7317 [Stylophora pistillata]
MTENHLAKVCRSSKDKFKAYFEKTHTKPHRRLPTKHGNYVHQLTMDTPASYSSDDDDYVIHSFSVFAHQHASYSTTDDKYFIWLPVSISPNRTIKVLMQMVQQPHAIHFRHLYRKMSESAPLQPSHAKIFPYSGKPIYPLGKVSLACEGVSHFESLEFQIMDSKDIPGKPALISGRNSERLGLIKFHRDKDTIAAKRAKAKQHYDTTANSNLPPFGIGDFIYAKPAPHHKSGPWLYGLVTTIPAPRSYIIKTPTGLTRRNRCHLRPAAPPPPEALIPCSWMKQLSANTPTTTTVDHPSKQSTPAPPPSSSEGPNQTNTTNSTQATPAKTVGWGWFSIDKDKRLYNDTRRIGNGKIGSDVSRYFAWVATKYYARGLSTAFLMGLFLKVEVKSFARRNSEVIRNHFLVPAMILVIFGVFAESLIDQYVGPVDTRLSLLLSCLKARDNQLHDTEFNPLTRSGTQDDDQGTLGRHKPSMGLVVPLLTVQSSDGHRDRVAMCNFEFQENRQGLSYKFRETYRYLSNLRFFVLIGIGPQVLVPEETDSTNNNYYVDNNSRELNYRMSFLNYLLSLDIITSVILTRFLQPVSGPAVSALDSGSSSRIRRKAVGPVSCRVSEGLSDSDTSVMVLMVGMAVMVVIATDLIVVERLVVDGGNSRMPAILGTVKVLASHGGDGNGDNDSNGCADGNNAQNVDSGIGGSCATIANGDNFNYW